MLPLPIKLIKSNCYNKKVEMVVMLTGGYLQTLVVEVSVKSILKTLFRICKNTFLQVMKEKNKALKHRFN